MSQEPESDMLLLNSGEEDQDSVNFLAKAVS